MFGNNSVSRLMATIADSRCDRSRSAIKRARRHRVLRWWSNVAARRAAEGAEGHHGYNLFTCARKDVPELVELQRSYDRELRRLSPLPSRPRC